MAGSESTIKFVDCIEDEVGLFCIRRVEGNIAVCLSLESSGDIEVVVRKETIVELIEALKKVSQV